MKHTSITLALLNMLSFSVVAKDPNNPTVLKGTITHVRDEGTIEVDGIAIRLLALNWPENGTQKGNYSTRLAKQFQRSTVQCELTGAKTYDRSVGYCSVNGKVSGFYMMNNSSCKVWEKYDIWKRYWNMLEEAWELTHETLIGGWA